MRRQTNANPMKEMNAIIKGYANSDERDDLLKTVVRLCLYEMEELPTMKMVKLLVCLSAPFKANLLETMEYCKWQKDVLERKKRTQLRKLQILAKKNKDFTELLNAHVIWFDNVKSYRIQEFVNEQPKRKVVADPRYRSGVYYSNKLKKNVQYESNTELKFIEKLESAEFVEYYLEQPITIKYHKNRKEYIYTPDFMVLLKDGTCFFAEIKAGLEDILDTRLHRHIEQLIHYCKQNGFGLLLYSGNRSFDNLMNCPSDQNLERIIGEKLAERGGRTIFIKEFREILEQTGTRKRDVLTLIFKNNWGFYPFPFKLTPKNPYHIFRDAVLEKYSNT